MLARTAPSPPGRPTVALLVLWCLAGVPGSLRAQSSEEAGTTPARGVPDRRGLMLGLVFGMATSSVPETKRHDYSGPLFGARVGWGFARRVSIQLDGDISAVEGDSAHVHAIGHTDLVGRYGFADVWRGHAPYLELGISRRYARVAKFEDPRTGMPGQLDASGTGLLVGVGVQSWDEPKGSLDFGLRVVTGRLRSKRFEWVTDDGVSTDLISVRLMVSLMAHPMARRYQR